MNIVEIGEGKRGRRGYSFDDLAVAPSRRTRDPEDVSLAWQIDAYQFAHPIVAAPMDSVVSPSTVKQFADAGGLAVLNFEGLWTRYEDPTARDLCRTDSSRVSPSAGTGTPRNGRNSCWRTVTTQNVGTVGGSRRRRCRHICYSRHDRQRRTCCGAR